MADPRGRGFGRLNNRHYARKPRIVGPECYGWQFERYSDIDGAAIYKLGAARLKANLQTGGTYVVLGEFVIDYSAGYSLEEITAEVKQELGMPDEISQPSGPLVRGPKYENQAEVDAARKHFNRVGWAKFDSYMAAGIPNLEKYATDGDRTAGHVLVLVRSEPLHDPQRDIAERRMAGMWWVDEDADQGSRDE